MKKTLIVIASVFLFVGGVYSQNQDVNISEEIEKVLAKSELEKYEKGKKQISKADLLTVVPTAKHEAAEKSRAKAEGKKRRKKKKELKIAKKYDKEAAKSYLPASNLYLKGGKYVYSALLKTLVALEPKATDGQKEVLKEFKTDYETFYKESGKLRKTALKQKDYAKKYMQLTEADRLLSQAYEHQAMALTEYYGWLRAKPDTEEVVVTTEVDDNEFAIYEEDTVTATEPVIPVKSAGVAGVVFKIQVAASAKPLSVNELKRIYPGDVMFNNEKSGPWYRYLINEYNTYAEAITDKRKMNIKGSFVVAYRSGERIKNIKEVAEPIGQYGNESSSMGSNSTSSNSGIEYRLQIGTSALPTSDRDIAKLNSTAEPVKVYKSVTYYKYTICSFATEKEALEYKKANSLGKYIIVKYSGGKEVK